MSYRGVDSINLDGKGRFSIPTKYRTELQDHCEGKLVVTANRERFLVLYPLVLWEEVENKLKNLPTLNEKAMRFKRFILGHACQCDMDGQGRILLPEKLREFAGLDKRIVLSSQIDKFEIWDEEAWEKNVNAWMQDNDSWEEMKDVAGDLVF
ncbi:MAG: division/cell wall cluster transcriptional repressor MraZ [Methylococcaceae bacterium]|nr:division/cell wall cluster transcriptional repressor MraZ [Methylococcaceae bacterium]